MIKQYEILRFLLDNDDDSLYQCLTIDNDDKVNYRYSFNNVRDCIDDNDKKLLLVSTKNYRYLDDICNNCDCCNEKCTNSVLHRLRCSCESITADLDVYEDILEADLTVYNDMLDDYEDDTEEVIL